MDNWMKSYNTGKEAYKKLNTVSDNKSALGQVRYSIMQLFPAVKMKKEKLDKDIKEINDTYSVQVAGPKIAEKKTAYGNEIATIQGKLKEQLTSVLQAKREAARKYVVTPPSQDQLSLLNALKLRGLKNVDDTEWQMYVATLAGNYQAAQILATMAEEAGKTFIPPVSSVEKLNESLNLAEAWFNDVIDNLSKPDDLRYRAMEMLTDRDNTPSAQLITMLDTEIISTVPSGSLSTKNRLKDAAQHALHMGQFDLFNEIYAFIGDNRDRLETPEEAQADFIAAAEKLIDAGNNAQESKRTAYDIKLDSLSEKVNSLSKDGKNE